MLSLDVSARLTLDQLGWKDKLIGYVVPLPVGHSPRVTVWLCFDDIREAVNAIDEVETVNPSYQAVYITQPEYAFGTQASGERGIQAATCFYDGQVTFTALLPAGIPGVKTTLKRPRVVFTTDVGPHVTVPGGHYMMIENMAAVDYDTAIRQIEEGKREIAEYEAAMDAWDAEEAGIRRTGHARRTVMEYLIAGCRDGGCVVVDGSACVPCSPGGLSLR